MGVHGINGNVKILSYAETLSIFEPDTPLCLKSPDGEKTLFTINWIKPHTKTVLLSLKEITDRNLAEETVGCDIYIDKKSLPEPEIGTYYWFDIIGLSVLTVEGECIGNIDSILQTGSNDVYVVKHPDTKDELLIPAIQSVVRSIDLDSKTITVKLPEGL